MEDDQIRAILKFQKRRYIEEFVGEGHLYMNPLSYFVECGTPSKLTDVRYDRDDGVSDWLQPSIAKLSIKVNGKFEEIPGICGPIRYHRSDALRANVFCMYGLRTIGVPPWVDERNFNFGDTFAILIDADEFLRRVEIAANQTEHKIRWSPVEYVDRSTYHGPK